MTDLALDPISRDLVFGGAPGKAALRLLDGPEETAQAIGIRLRCWLGEWFLDATHGVPYLEQVLGKNRRREIVEAVLRAQILGVDGVSAIESLTLTLDRQQRTARVDFVALTPKGPAAGSVPFAS